MASLIEVESMQAGYVDIISRILRYGKPRSPRGIATRELVDTTIVFNSINNALPQGTGRRVNFKIAAAEALQLIGGFSNPELAFWSTENFRHYCEPNGEFWGAYGRRIGFQLIHVVHKLKHDPSTRQAMITLWDPKFDNEPNKNDYPCTIAMNFAIIDNRLCMKTFMRSNDVWLGLTYDVFQFTQLQWCVAMLLDLEPGSYTHIALSLHLYERDLSKAETIHSPIEKFWLPEGITSCATSVSDLYDTARKIISPLYEVSDDVNERWYYAKLAGFNNTL